MSLNGNGKNGDLDLPVGKRGRIPEGEMIRRLEIVAVLIAQRRTRGQIRSELAAMGIAVSGRSVTGYISRARLILKSRLSAPIAESRAKSFGLYESIIQHPGSSMSEKIAAQWAIDKLLGLCAKESLQVDVTVEAKEAADLRRLALSELREILAKRADN